MNDCPICGHVADKCASVRRETYYQKLIREIDPTLTPKDARGVEGHMRCMYGTLNHLDRATFKREIKLYRACERNQPGYGESLANAYGL